MKLNDNICAMATPSGGAIGIVRVSGPDSISIVGTLFSRNISEAKSHTMHYGVFASDSSVPIDDVMVAVFRAPHSYTGEDSVEIYCHGSRYIMSQIIRCLIEAGCRQADPGEYTRRAFINGKMDLSQAEAVADLIAASGKASHNMALGQLRGNISNELSALRDQLLKMTSLMELELDFSDHEELEFADRTALFHLATTIQERISSLASSFRTGQAIKQGIPVAIIGKTNVGKSTLLNRLVGEDKAIVSDIHGTTRDIIEDTIDIHGITFRFVDTAGLRATDDVIERIGIERSYSALSKAAIVLWVIDSRPTDEEIADITRRCEGKQLIVVINKTDKYGAPSLSLPFTTLSISALQGSGIAFLKDTIYEKSDIPEIGENDAIITSARHYDSLLHAKESIDRVIEGLNMSIPNDLLSEDLRQCLDALAEITGGVITSSEVLYNIFSHFCIGK
ncbi:MAG: tRNA uridine-5-carboxymethylaminomethyl(34) synthesis GTPase MnmE [Prevotella sp.]